jgi:hypothetical protein
MTRRSRRGVEREIEELETAAARGEPLGLPEALEWANHVRDHGVDAKDPAEYFGHASVEWGLALTPMIEWTKEHPNFNEENWNPAEVYALRFGDPDVSTAILERRQQRAAAGPADEKAEGSETA